MNGSKRVSQSESENFRRAVPPPNPLLVFSPVEAERMARREFQNPSILERDSAAGREFYIRYRIKVMEIENGRPFLKRKEKWHTLGPVSMGIRKAERKRDEIMREVNQQVYTVQSHVPFEDFIKIYRSEHYRGLKETSVRYYDQRIDAWILPTLGKKKLYQISPLDVSFMLAEMERANVARSTRIATRAILSNIFEQARRWGYLKEPDNPARDAEVGRTDNGGRMIWTPTLEQARKVVARADSEVGLILESIIWTGMRISEVLGLRCCNVDTDHAVVYVRERNVRRVMDDPKSRAGQRALPLGSLAPRLAPLIGGPDDFLFRDSVGGCFTDQLLHRRIRKALKDAGCDHAGNAWHAFRRLHLTLMSSRMSLFDLRAQAGHTDIRTTQKYVAGGMESRAEALRVAQGGKVVVMKKGKPNAGYVRDKAATR